MIILHLVLMKAMIIVMMVEKRLVVLGGLRIRVRVSRSCDDQIGSGRLLNLGGR